MTESADEPGRVSSPTEDAEQHLAECWSLAVASGACDCPPIPMSEPSAYRTLVRRG